MTATLSLPPVPSDFFGSPVFVHVAGFSAYESLIGFDLPRELIDGSQCQSMADSMIHEPSGLLSNPDGPVNLIGRYAVFAVHNLPHRHEPLRQGERRVLENGPSLGRKLASIVLSAALPTVILRKVRDVLGAATGAFHAIRPTARYHILAAVVRIREIFDCVLKSVEFRLHDQIIARLA
jgi:hypothetical protein